MWFYGRVLCWLGVILVYNSNELNLAYMPIKALILAEIKE